MVLKLTGQVKEAIEKQARADALRQFGVIKEALNTAAVAGALGAVGGGLAGYRNAKPEDTLGQKLKSTLTGGLAGGATLYGMGHLMGNRNLSTKPRLSTPATALALRR